MRVMVKGARHFKKKCVRRGVLSSIRARDLCCEDAEREPLILRADPQEAKGSQGEGAAGGEGEKSSAAGKPLCTVRVRTQGTRPLVAKKGLESHSLPRDKTQRIESG